MRTTRFYTRVANMVILGVAMGAPTLLGLDRTPRFIVQMLLLVVGGGAYQLGLMTASAPDDESETLHVTR
jgi:hypothetical protein